MQGSGFGDIFHISTFGESHGKGVGVVIDGVPAGLPLTEEDIMEQLSRRRPGQSAYTTQRSEADEVEIYSGLFEGYTTGTPIMMLVRNTDQRSRDYSNIKDIYRPGHGDLTYDQKFGIRDYRGGGRSSARETIGRVCAGAVAMKALRAIGVGFITYTESIGSCFISSFDEAQIWDNPLGMPDEAAARQAMELLDKLRAEGDSAGGTAICRVINPPAGLGEPVFAKLDATLAQAMLSIGAVKAFEIGSGTVAPSLLGSENNDEIVADEDGLRKLSNNAGGILAGISDGSDIVMRIHFKPTPSISRPQQTIDTDGMPRTIKITGRHDPVVVPRALVVVESMAAIVIFDAVLKNLTSSMDNIISFYEE